MKLAQSIQEFQESMKGMIPEEAMLKMTAATKKLIETGITDRCLKTGDKIPYFTLPNAIAEEISIKNLLENGPVVINFYRGAWCPYCNLELAAYQKALPEIEALGAKLIAISPNLPDKSLSSIEKHNLKFEVLSDIGNKIAEKFGLVFVVDEDIRSIYKNMDIDIPGHNGDESWKIPIPATYVVDKNGTILGDFVDADYTKRMEPSDVIDILKKRKNGN